MYAALWRALPGNRWVKALECLGLAVLVVTVLFVWVFPAIAPLLPYQDVAVAAGARSRLRRHRLERVADPHRVRRARGTDEEDPCSG